MWNDKRRGFNLIRKRNDDRNNKRRLIKNGIYSVFFISVIIVAAFGINSIKSSRNIERSSIEASNNNIDIYVDKADKNNNGTSIDTEKNVNIVGKDEDTDKTADTPIVNSDKTFSFVALGEIMMGGNYSLNSTSYTLPFKNVTAISQGADYTFSSLTTNIVDIDRIENPKSKYIVTKDITKAFNALGIKGINVASDHMLDFGKNIFNDTKSILNDQKLDIIGLQGDIIYAEANGIKVAFIGVCNEVIGAYSKFTDAGIWMYDDYMTKIKSGITKARSIADTVIVITHLGSENNHEITDVMSWFSHELINAGADMVLGNHALGIYPIEIYKSKPIIYSLGYFFGDTEYEVGKKSGIFKFTVDTKGKITGLELVPTYIENSEVHLYYDLDSAKAVEFMKYISSTSSKYGYDVDISKKLTIQF